MVKIAFIGKTQFILEGILVIFLRGIKGRGWDPYNMLHFVFQQQDTNIDETIFMMIVKAPVHLFISA